MDDAKKFSLAMQSYISPELARSSLPPIIEYLHKYSRGAQPYPRQATLLKIIFLDIEHFTDYDYYVVDEWMKSTREGGDVEIPLDLYDRIDWCKEQGYWHFREVINCTGRRGGKGYIGGILAEYMTAFLLTLGNPQRYYGLEESKEIVIEILATQFLQAQTMLYADAKNAILSDDFIAPYIYSTSNMKQQIQTVADIERQKRQKNGKIKMMGSVPASIVVRPYAAASNIVRGQAAILQMFDEFAHGYDDGTSNQSSSMIYEAATPAIATFGGDGMIYIPSSPWSETGKFYERYSAAMKIVDGFAHDPSMFAFRAPSWELYKDFQYDPTKKRALILPPEKSIEMRAKEEQNPDTFAVEFRAKFAKTENAYMQSSVVDSLFEPFPVGKPKNIMVKAGQITYQYRAHADAGRSQDLFAFAIGHKEYIDGHWHAFIDMYRVWQPLDFPADENGIHRVDYTVVLEELRNIFRSFFTAKMTFDQWNSAFFIDQLQRDSMNGRFFNKTMGVSVDNHTQKSNFQRYERFKTACYQGWVHIPKYEQDIFGLGHVCLPQEELKLLVIKNGNRIDHQNSGVWQHNDMADCIATVVADLLADQLDSLENGNVGAVVGGAQGGYNLNDNGFIAGGASDAINRALSNHGDDMMRRLGYL